MKLYKLAVFFLWIGLSVNGQDCDTLWRSSNNHELGVSTFKKDFGIITQGDKAGYKFVLKNLSTEPLVIWHVTSSCGCTTPSWTKKPVKPNGEARIKVKFEAEDTGVFTKSVFVYTNFDDKPIKLSIQGTVVHPKSHTSISKRTTHFNSSLPQNQ